MADTTTVAVVGTGRMGAAMAATLARAGFDVVLHNRTRSRGEPVARATGAQIFDTAREAAAAAQVVISSLADDRAVVDTYAGPDGVAAGLDNGSVVLEMSTIDPGTVQTLRGLVEGRGATLLDAPVSGSVALVEQGTLTVMVGGDAAGLERARPVLDALAAQVFHVGDLGAGATMKLAVNALVHAINIALSESLVLAERAGVDRVTAYDVFAAGAGAAPFVHYKRAAFENPDDTPVAFSLDLVAKDLDLILGLAQRVGAPLHQARANREVAGRALSAGLGDRDMSAVAVLLRDNGPGGTA